MPDKCLLCYQPLDGDGPVAHARCVRTLFLADVDATLPFSPGDIDSMAKAHVLEHVTVPGVQKKLSLHLEASRGRRSRLTLVGYRAGYILKPPTAEYPELPELEDATMHMAEACGIPVVPHGLVLLQGGERAYISRRVDRAPSGSRLHMEDLCQVSDRLTEHKYHGSVEQVGKLIYTHSITPGLDRINYFELLLFCFVTGNADMHLKNFSLLRMANGYRLAPAYDLLPTVLLLPEDEEESALTVDGRKKRLSRAAFLRAAETMGIPKTAALKSIDAILSTLPKAMDCLRGSFVSDGSKQRYETLIAERAARLH